MGPNTAARQGIFISYARADGQQAAFALHARLAAEAPDLPAWLDRFEIEGGVGWWNQIEHELDRAEFLVLMMTPAAMRSENTRREWRSARERGVCVYPVKCAPDAELDFASLPNWMRKAHFYDPNVEWQKLLAHLRRGCQATRVPFMARALPSGFVARPAETAQVLDSILTADNNPRNATVALRGAGGFGKTTLAAAICHDNRCIEGFDDGILWVTLGQSPNVLNELVKLYAALTGERLGFIDIEDAARELALKLESKNCLIVVDDAWSSAHVKPFLIGGPGCAHLVTTRLFEVTLDTQRVDINQMTAAEALQLLLARAGVSAAQPGPFGRLAELLGLWPLPIKLAGSAMRQRIARGEAVDKALDYVFRALDKRGITAFDNEQAPTRQDAVARTIGASLEMLAPEEQRRCAELAIFRSDETVPIGTAAALWALDDIDSEDLARKLDEFALIEFDLRRATLRIHDELRGFLIKRIADVAAVHRKLIDAWGDPDKLPDPYAWRSYAYHLRHAGPDSALRALLLNVEWLEAKSAAVGINSVVADFEYAGGDRVTGLVRDALRLAAPSLATDMRQLRSQLIGRLLARDEPEIVALRAAAALQAQDDCRLIPLHPTLDAPGGLLLMTLVGHAREVTSLAADSTFNHLVSASNDATVRVWDARTGQQKHVLFDSQHGLGIRAVALTADGRLALSGGANGNVYLWDASDGALQHCAMEASRALTSVAISEEGQIAICASRETKLTIWDVQTRSTVQTLVGHSERITSVSLSSTGTRAVSGSDDCTVCVWNIPNAALERVLEGHTAAVNCVALSRDGSRALSGSDDRTIKLWDVDSGRCLRTLTTGASVISIALAAEGGRFLAAGSDRTVNLWQLESGTILARLEGHTDVVRTVAINRTGTVAATGSADATIKLWRLDDVRSPARVGAHESAVELVAFSPNGQLYASGSNDGRVTVLDVGSGQPVQTFDAHTAPVRSLAFTSDSGCVLSAGRDARYWLWVIEGAAETRIPVRHLAPVDDSALSLTARYLVTACGDQFIYIWDVPSGAPIARYGTRRMFDHLITPSPRRRELPQTEELLDAYLPGETVYKVHVAAMSSDGTLAIFSATSRNFDGDYRIPAERNRPGATLLAFKVETGEIHSITVPQADPIAAFAVDASGTRLLWARQDHCLELWDLQNETRIAILRGHSEYVNAVCFTQDGAHAFSCGRDRTVRAWELSSATAIATFTADAALRSLALSADQHTLAAGDMAGRVHLLNIAGMQVAHP